MLGYVYHKDKTLILQDVPRPERKPGFGALIRVLACSVCGTDIRTYRFGSAKIDDNRIIGHELVGEIVEIAPEFSGEFCVGDRISMAPAIGCGRCTSCRRKRTNMCDDLTTIGFQYDGGFAEYMAVPDQAFRMGNVYRLPEQWEDISLFAISEPLACAINAQSYLKIQEGETVLIFGSGIIGCMHAELALMSGAGKVFLSEPQQARLEQAAALLPGVCFINSSEKNLRDEIMAATGGEGVDVVIVACSVGPAQKEGMSLLAKCGRISLFGGLPGESTGFIDSNLIHYRELSVYGVHASTPQQNKKAMSLIRDGAIDVSKYIDRYPLEQVEEAFRAAAAGEIIKAVIVNQ